MRRAGARAAAEAEWFGGRRHGSRRLLLATALFVGLGALGGGCGSTTSDSGSDQRCTPNETQECLGPGRCEGSQACLPDGSGYTECDCGEGSAATAGAAGTGGSDRDGPTGGEYTSGGRGGTQTGGSGGTPTGGLEETPTGGNRPTGGQLTGGVPPTGGFPTGGWVAEAGAGMAGLPPGAGGAVCGDSPPSVDATVQTEVRTLNYDSGNLRVRVTHKQDADVADGGGCVTNVRIELAEAGYDVCLLTLVFDSVAADTALWLASAELSAQNSCPNWSDADEGDYYLVSPHDSGQLDLGGETVPEGGYSNSCLITELEPTGVITLQQRRGERQLTMDLSSIRITGGFWTVGSGSACCPGEQCARGAGGAGAGGAAGASAGMAGMAGHIVGYAGVAGTAGS
jgi:hypothetical protein